MRGAVVHSQLGIALAFVLDSGQPSTEGRYTPGDLRTWDSWFDNALPTSTEEHIAFVDSVRDESNPLSGHFYIPDADPALLTDDAEAFKSRPKQTSFHSIADETKPSGQKKSPLYTGNAARRSRHAGA